MSKLKTIGVKFSHDGSGLFLTDQDAASIILRSQQVLRQYPLPEEAKILLQDLEKMLASRHDDDIVILHSLRGCTDHRTMRRIQIERAVKRGGMPMQMLSKESLFEKFWVTAKKADEQSANEIVDYAPDPNMAKHKLAQEEFPTILTECLHDIIEDAWAQVDFGTENISISDKDSLFLHGLLGYQNIDGHTFIGVDGHEDGELPVFFIVYWDGKSLQAYVPKHGNCYDPETKSAFCEDGEDYKEWIDSAKSSRAYPHDQDEIIAEIKSKFIVKKE